MGNFPKSILGIILVITLLNIVQVHSEALQYPKVRRDEKIVDDYHGTKVRDPYRWLEKPDSDRVANFVEAQNELTYNYLNDCQQRKQFRESLNELWEYPKYGIPVKRGSRYFYFAQQRGGEVLHVQETRESQPRALINPQINGVMAFPSMGVSKDGELVVYREVIIVEGFPRISGNLRILNVTNGTVFADVIEDVRNSQIAWDKTSRGFFYFSHRRYDGSDESDEETPPPPPKIYVYYHKVGTKVEDDVLAVDYADYLSEPSFVDIETSEDSNFLLLRGRAYSGSLKAPKTNSTFYVADISKFESTNVTGRLQLVPVVTKRDSPFLKYVTNIGNLFYFRSRIGNKNYRLIEIDLLNPSEEKWRVIIDENPNYTLQAATAVDKLKVVVSYGSDKLNSYAELRYLQNGSLIRMFPLEFGELLSFSGLINDSEVLFRSTKLEGLPELYYFDTTDPKGSMKQLVKQPTLSNYDSSLFATEMVTYPSSDGNNVEMIIVGRKDLKRDGTSFAFIVEREFDLDFYFRVYFSYMKDFNCVVAFPHLEENGVGFRDSALEDFIAAAEYLVQQGYTSNSRIIARGQSTFGLFVAAAVNKRPELFGAAVPSLVAFDMLRYEAATNWTASSSGSFEDPDSFNKTYSISPLHNIRLPPANESALQYPAILIPTANEYPVPLAFKYIAELQYTLGANVRQTNPLLLRLVPEPRDAIDIGVFASYHIDRETDIRCFLQKTIGLKQVK